MKSKILSPKKKKEMLTSPKCVALMTKAVMVRAQRLRMTWDSEVTCEDDADEEMDTTVIAEEDWIEYMKRSTEDAMDKLERAKIRC